MAAPIVAAGIAAIMRYIAKEGVKAATKKYGKESVKKAQVARNLSGNKSKTDKIYELQEQVRDMAKSKKMSVKKFKEENKGNPKVKLLEALKDSKSSSAKDLTSNKSMDALMKLRYGTKDVKSPSSSKAQKTKDEIMESARREFARIRKENPGGKIKNNTLNRGGMANCGASVAPNGKSRS